MLIDPINAPAAQVPDAWPYATQATKLKMTYDVLVNADGNFAVAIGHGLTNFLRKFTVTTTTGVFTTTILETKAHSDAVAYAAAFDRSRMTSMGVTFTNFVTPETGMGMVSIQSCPEESLAGYNTDAITVAAMMNDGTSATVEEGIVGFAYPMEEPQFSTTHVYWASLPITLFMVKGAKPSSTIGQLEIVINLEGVADPSSVHAGGSSVEPYDPVSHVIGTHVTQHTGQTLVQRGKAGHRRLTSHGRAIADLSASVLGYGVGGATGVAISQAPSVYREKRKKLKALLQSMRA